MAKIPFQQDRYLWVHFAGLAAVPLLFDICLAGLASAGPAFDYPAAGGWQFWLLAVLCVGPPLWMQIARPFYMFSLPPLALKSAVLTEDQRRCLQLLKSVQIKIIAVAVAVFSVWVLWQVWVRSLLLSRATPLFTPTAGLILAVVSFFFACLFLQISVSAGRSLFVGPETLKRVEPVAVGAIASNFSILGLGVKSILPSPTQETAADKLADEL